MPYLYLFILVDRCTFKSNSAKNVFAFKVKFIQSLSNVSSDSVILHVTVKSFGSSDELHLFFFQSMMGKGM